MNSEGDMLALLSSVLGLAVGESWALRESRHFDCTIHRYDDGWYVLVDHITDRVFSPRAVLGWYFNRVEDMADFLTGALGHRIVNHAIIGDRE